MRVAAGVEVHAVPKPGGGTRWLTTLAAPDDAAYRRLVERHLPAIRSGRSAGVAPGPGVAPPTLAAARRRWRSRLRLLASGAGSILVTDVADCYGSITPAAVEAGLAGVGERLDDELAGFLRAVAAVGSPGLPIGPPPSAVLADAVLAVGDRAARVAGADVLRWVDDVVLVADDRRTVLRAFDAWRQTLGRLGLRPHEGKTRWRAPGGCVGSGAIGSDLHAMMRAP
jgi:hypothetical protein